MKPCCIWELNPTEAKEFQLYIGGRLSEAGGLVLQEQLASEQQSQI